MQRIKIITQNKLCTKLGFIYKNVDICSAGVGKGFSPVFLMRDLKRHLIFSSPGCDLLTSLFKCIRDLSRLKKNENPYLKTTQAYLVADVVQMTVFLIT
jgi:hypothetical protein